MQKYICLGGNINVIKYNTTMIFVSFKMITNQYVHE